MTPFYRFSRVTMRLLLAALTDLTIEGLENVPPGGPLIVVSNHLHNADPPLLGAVLPLFIRYMAKQETFESPWGRLFASAYGAFPVRRGQVDREALRKAEAILRAGGVLGMFPEGHRSHGRGLLPAFDGVALLARRGGVPLLPVAVIGTERVFKPWPRWPITVRVGKPFELDGQQRSLPEATREIMLHIARLLPPAYRGVYELPNGRPDLARQEPSGGSPGSGSQETSLQHGAGPLPSSLTSGGELVRMLKRAAV